MMDYDNGDNPLDSIDLLICAPITYGPIDLQNIADETHEGWEPEDSLMEKIKEFNAFLKTFPPHSWKPGKIRTSYVLPDDVKNDQ